MASPRNAQLALFESKENDSDIPFIPLTDLEAQAPAAQLPLCHPYWVKTCDMLAMFTGCIAWLLIYKLAPQFEDAFGEDAGYAMHVITMGLVADIVAYFPTVWGRQYDGYDKFSARVEGVRYFAQCTPQDIAFEPTADLVIATAKSGNPFKFNFEKYADPEFSAFEVGISPFYFGIGLALLYYIPKKGLKNLQKWMHTLFNKEMPEGLDQHEELNSRDIANLGYRFIHCTRKLLSTAEWEALKNAFQGVVFYFNDFFFDVDNGPAYLWLLNIVGSAFVMALYSGLMDSLGDLFEHLENKLYPPDFVPQISQPSMMQQIRLTLFGNSNPRQVHIENDHIEITDKNLLANKV